MHVFTVRDVGWDRMSIMGQVPPGNIILVDSIMSYEVFPWEEKLIAPLIAALNGECANEKTKDKAKKLDYRLRMLL